ncbi:MAG: FtsX-like permease family protein [Thermoanaerobaculum sp.]|nr:FtsX-like permease family protein [Thermoanaerobaculum sp.]
MQFLLFLVPRYLLGLARRTQVAVVSAISFVSLALGAMALVLTLALLEGFQSTVRRELKGTGPHALLLPAQGKRLPAGPWLDQLTQAHPQLRFCKVERGVAWMSTLGEATPVEVEVVAGLFGVEVDRVRAAMGGVGVGSEVDLLTPVPLLSPLGPTPRQVRVRVERVVEGASKSSPGSLRVPTAVGELLLGGSGREEVQVAVPPPLDPLVVTERLGPLPAGVVLRSFRELNRPLLAALALEKLLIGLGVALIVVVASLNLLCNLTMLAAEKRADAAILQAMGLPPRGIAQLFRTLGLAIGAGAGLAGCAFGWGLAALLHRTQALPLPRGVFALNHVPFAVLPEHLALVMGVTMVAAWAATSSPARAAARRSVLEGLRRE